MKLFLIILVSLLSSLAALGQADSSFADRTKNSITDSLSDIIYMQSRATPGFYSSLFKHVIKVSNANEEDYQIYYSSDSLYIFYRYGHDGNNAFYCKEYSYPLDDTDGYAFAESEPYINFKNRSMFLKMMNRVGKLPNIKKPVAASNKFSTDDTVNIDFPNKTSKLIQLAQIDSFNIVYLVQDTVSFEGYLIWNHKLLGRSLSYSVTDTTHPPEK